MSAEQANNQGVVVIGAGLAGWHVIDAIRSKDKDVPITLITADNADRYHKPMLTMAISQNKRAADLVRASGADAASASNVNLLAHTVVTDIHADKQTISIKPADTDGDDSETIGYDKLVLAMGAHPIFPPSLPRNVVWHVNHIEQFGRLQDELANGSQRVAIVGAGMVGTEIAEDLLKAGHEVTLIDLNDAPLSQMLPATATARIAKAIDSQGIRFLGNTQVNNVSRLENGALQVDYHHNDGTGNSTSIEVDHVIASTGLMVDEALPTAAGVGFDRRTGITVDASTLRTDADHIYAIGDCMSIDGVPCRYVAPLRAQAATIADDILGAEHAGYAHKPPMIRLKNKAISVMATGTPHVSGNWQTTTETEDELVMERLDEAGNVIATVTIKSPTA